MAHFRAVPALTVSLWQINTKGLRAAISLHSSRYFSMLSSSKRVFSRIVFQSHSFGSKPAHTTPHRRRQIPVTRQERTARLRGLYERGGLFSPAGSPKQKSGNILQLLS
jgi:hypothetical protein